jgi:hypothetical protein
MLKPLIGGLKMKGLKRLLSIVTVLGVAVSVIGLSSCNLAAKSKAESQAAELNNHATTLDNSGRYGDAIAEYTKAISLAPNKSLYYINRAKTYYRKEDYSLAIADLDKAISLDPQNSDAYFTRGIAYEVLGQNDKALSDFNKVIQLNNDPSVMIRAESEIKNLPVNRPPIVTPAGQSVYDGDYFGNLVYHYRFYDDAGQPGEWITKTLEIRLTLKSGISDAFAKQMGVPVALTVTKVQVNDPDFGTGLGGVTPTIGTAMLPSDPPVSSAKSPMGIFIACPNGATISIVSEFSVGTPPLVSMHSTPAFHDNTWWVTIPHGVLPGLANGKRNDVLYWNWDLAKSAQ